MRASSPSIGESAHEAHPLNVVSAGDLVGSPPERRFHVPGLVPAGNVTTLSGDGGTGKSLLALQLAVATVLGRKWCGRQIVQGGCLFLSAEDDIDELHRRLADIRAREGVDIEELAELLLVPLADGDSVLAAPERGGTGGMLKPTQLYHEVEELIVRHRPALIVLDTLADVFGGSEIDRGHARQFIRLLRRWCLKHDCSLLLLAHPSLQGMSSGSGSSGSTGWSNSVRSRLYLERHASDRGNNADARVLSSKKANYSRAGATVQLRWRNGVFLVEDAVVASPANVQAEEERIDELFLTLLDRRNVQCRPVGPSPSSNYAPTVFAKDKLAGDIPKSAFEAAMRRLFDAGKIKVEEQGPPSRRTKSIVQVEPPREK